MLWAKNILIILFIFSYGTGAHAGLMDFLSYVGWTSTPTHVEDLEFKDAGPGLERSIVCKTSEDFIGFLVRQNETRYLSSVDLTLDFPSEQIQAAIWNFVPDLMWDELSISAPPGILNNLLGKLKFISLLELKKLDAAEMASLGSLLGTLLEAREARNSSQPLRIIAPPHFIDELNRLEARFPLRSSIDLRSNQVPKRNKDWTQLTLETREDFLYWVVESGRLTHLEAVDLQFEFNLSTLGPYVLSQIPRLHWKKLRTNACADLIACPLVEILSQTHELKYLEMIPFLSNTNRKQYSLQLGRSDQLANQLQDLKSLEELRIFGFLNHDVTKQEDSRSGIHFDATLAYKPMLDALIRRYQSNPWPGVFRIRVPGPLTPSDAYFDTKSPTTDYRNKMNQMLDELELRIGPDRISIGRTAMSD